MKRNNLKKLLITGLFVAIGVAAFSACAHTHTFEHEEVIAPTCTEWGYTASYCDCGEVKKESYVAPNGHDFTEDVVSEAYKASAATSEQKARYYYSCACGEKGTETFEYGNYVYTVTYEIEHGGTISGAASQSVEHGQSGSSVTAIPDENHEFIGWSDGVQDATRREVDVQGNITVSPLFKDKEYAVIYQGMTADYTYFYEVVRDAYSNDITFEAKEVLGYRFVSWSDGNTSPVRTDTKASDLTKYVATYEIEPLDLPVVEIVTEEYQQIVSKETYVACTVSVSNTQEEYCMTEVVAGIRGRGNSTWSMPKKPYRIKFDKKQSMFGSSYKAKSWTLINNYTDKTLSRNAVAQELAAQMDDIAFASTRQFVEVYLNREYLGVYLFCDQMQTGEGRVEVDESFATDGNNGYLLELDGRAPDEGVENVDWFRLDECVYAIKTPDTEDEDYDPTVQLPYIKGYLNECILALQEKDWTKITSLMDVNSFADVYLVQELFANADCGWTSFYLYKDTDGKLFAGPVWDFDISSGNDNYAYGKADSCPCDDGLWAAETNAWFKYLLGLDEFVDLVASKLQTYQSTIAEVFSLVNPENGQGYYANYSASLERNFVRWNILSTPLGQEPTDLGQITTVEGHFDYLYAWLTGRNEYLCEVYGVL